MDSDEEIISPALLAPSSATKPAAWHEQQETMQEDELVYYNALEEGITRTESDELWQQHAGAVLASLDSAGMEALLVALFQLMELIHGRRMIEGKGWWGVAAKLVAWIRCSRVRGMEASNCLSGKRKEPAEEGDVPEHQEERRKGKAKMQKRVHDNELEVAGQGVASKLLAGQDSSCQIPPWPEADGGPGKKSQLTESGGSSQVAGIQAHVRAEVEKSGACSFKSNSDALGLTVKQVRDSSRVFKTEKRTEATTANGVKTHRTVCTEFARDSDGNVLLRSQLVNYPTLEAPSNPVWFRIRGLTGQHRMPWEHAAGSAARAPPRQEEDLETRLLGELHHFGVVTQIVVRLDPSDTAWVQFVDVCASAEMDLIMLGNNNNVEIERCSGPVA